MSETHPSNDGKIPAEIDFSSGTRGKFYRPGAKCIDFSSFVNNMLRKDIELIEMAK